MYIIIAGCIGVLVGGVIGTWWAKRKMPAAVFVEGSAEGEVLRSEATKVVHARIEKRKMRIIDTARAEGKITNDGVENMFCIGDQTAGRYLGQLVEEGTLVKVGRTGRGVYYVPAD